MTPHLAWLWGWFLFGMSVYMLKRAYYLTTGPAPIAHSYSEFIRRSWIPLFVRGAVDSGVFWACFTPQLLAQGLSYLGWASAQGVIALVTKFAVCAFFFGLAVDSAVDFSVSKVPFLKGWLPQMPPALPQPAIMQAAIVETKVTALETTTTTLPK
jgi:hypothetical protein